ncbi:hypothetical protein SS50377_26360 [Spironucleus salmonicida]|uniref:Uncharacterized protein n=1 Tax=Spironucleus salmonicida TaxID=348837 RepID=V6LU53_9EUKA|nr:hypothetical protein SS50377_26360 [Spironucleus salmonicida]|eukprot:EST47773.1 Hypothetical protein SS50377_12172 [Spironucleus salmonicida]
MFSIIKNKGLLFPAQNNIKNSKKSKNILKQINIVQTSVQTSACQSVLNFQIQQLIDIDKEIVQLENTTLHLLEDPIQKQKLTSLKQSLFVPQQQMNLLQQKQPFVSSKDMTINIKDIIISMYLPPIEQKSNIIDEYEELNRTGKYCQAKKLSISILQDFIIKNFQIQKYQIKTHTQADKLFKPIKHKQNSILMSVDQITTNVETELFKDKMRKIIRTQY